MAGGMSLRGTGCARKSACGGPLRTRCVLRFSYLRAIADRWSDSFHRREEGGAAIGCSPFCMLRWREWNRTTDPYRVKARQCINGYLTRLNQTEPANRS